MGRKYEHLSREERTMIQLGLEQSCTPSSISRELNRNGWSNPATAPRKRGRPLVAGGYRVPLAQQRASTLARTARLSLSAGPGRSALGACRTPAARPRRRSPGPDS